MSDTLFAHSLSGRPFTEWERLADHLAAVGHAAGERGEAFGWGEAARAAGMLHDIGKASAAFQAYIRAPDRPGHIDHSTAGALEARRLYGSAGQLLAFAIAGHHAGLADGPDLQRRLQAAPGKIPSYDGWQDCVVPPVRAALATCPAPRVDRLAPKGFAAAFLTRMLFSCLVDADYVATERFCMSAEGAVPARGGFVDIPALADRLRAHLRGFASAAASPVNELRARVLLHATAQAPQQRGHFTLTVPTGGGKTLTSLAFALEHARHHGLRRVIYVIPYTSIIEQTVQVFRDAIGGDDVLAHYASYDWETALPRSDSASAADAQEGRDGVAKLRLAAENWDAPIIVTTAVQFFESLFASRGARCRKLHNIAQSVIVLDEVQTLPLPLLHPCLAALDELARNYGASVVLCTATQPALRLQDGFKAGLDIPPQRELAPNPPQLYTALRRVAVERRVGKTEDADIAARFAAVEQMLVIVDSRAHARDLFALIRSRPGAAHLTTLMCPRHRSQVLEAMKRRLKAGEPVRLVATGLIEAGVDVDFPEVWRAMAGLDRIAQAAGRCNREGRLGALGRVVVFEPAAHAAPQALRLPCDVAAAVLARHSDPLMPQAVEDFFRNLYWSRGQESFDASKLEGHRYPILRKIADRAPTLEFPFASIARAFRVIDEAMQPVIVPWDEAAQAVLRRVATMDRPLRDDLRKLQQYVIPVPSRARAEWLELDVLRPVNAALGTALLAFADASLYDSATGLRLDAPAYRNAESNIW